MLDTEHQGVASEIMNFSRVITNARAQANFQKSISLDLHYKNKNFA